MEPNELATREEALRNERRTERLLRQSGLPVEKTFRTFEPKRLSLALQLHIERLKNGTFLEQAINVIAMGKPALGRAIWEQRLGMNWCLPVMRSSGPRPVISCSTCLLSSET